MVPNEVLSLWGDESADDKETRAWVADPSHTSIEHSFFSSNIMRRRSRDMVRVTGQSYYNDVIMSVMASQVTSLTIVYSTVYSGADQRTHQSSALLAFVRGIHRWPVNSPHKGPVTRKMFPFDDVIMIFESAWWMPKARRLFGARTSATIMVAYGPVGRYHEYISVKHCGSFLFMYDLARSYLMWESTVYI